MYQSSATNIPRAPSHIALYMHVYMNITSSTDIVFQINIHITNGQSKIKISAIYIIFYLIHFNSSF